MEFEPTETKHVWKNKSNGKFVWEDEANVFSEEYNTKYEAESALNKYAAWLNGTS